MTFDKTQLAWAAGLFEGEGCFSFTQASGSRSLFVSLGMTDEDVVRRFREVIGFGVIYNRKPCKAHWKPQFTWRIGSFEQVQAFIAFVWPWLCSRRRAKAKVVLRSFHAAEPESVQRRHKRNQSILAALQLGDRTQAAIAQDFGVAESTVWYVKSKAA